MLALEDWAEEAALIANNAASVLRILEGSLTLRVLERLDAILLIEGHAGKSKQ